MDVHKAARVLMREPEKAKEIQERLERESGIIHVTYEMDYVFRKPRLYGAPDGKATLFIPAEDMVDDLDLEIFISHVPMSNLYRGYSYRTPVDMNITASTKNLRKLAKLILKNTDPVQGEDEE